ncbi:MAG: peptide-methionine (S)-S-oxide reductase [Deltaproteobacteria bacterium HGW-Deltaproteobacteria-13]|jgi:peptide-methionine (S)-S-oxide reductase|nr:MAG: peptide-methionine (S)-S-oxide reductase [Deltaproteobacteria bacterium HGW-Deltaproteobacteria-13]
MTADPAIGAQKDMDTKGTKSMHEEITLGGGCFWCLDAVYREIKGVEKVISGYSGGSMANPDYEKVTTGLTGHAEVVQITFNPRIITQEKILQIFFVIHDPTTLNCQGADIGTQYRSIIFYRNQKQKDVIDKVIGELKKEKVYENSIVTEVVPFQSFYAAEDYHQDFYKKNKQAGYCQFIINPKLEKFKKTFQDNLKN